MKHPIISKHIFKDIVKTVHTGNDRYTVIYKTVYSVRIGKKVKFEIPVSHRSRIYFAKQRLAEMYAKKTEKVESLLDTVCNISRVYPINYSALKKYGYFSFDAQTVYPHMLDNDDFIHNVEFIFKGNYVTRYGRRCIIPMRDFFNENFDPVKHVINEVNLKSTDSIIRRFEVIEVNQ